MSIHDRFANLDAQAIRRGLRKGLKVASEAASVAVQLRNDTGPLGIISVAAKVANGLVGETRPSPIAGFIPVPNAAPLEHYLLTVARKRRLVEAEAGNGTGDAYWLGTIDGCRFGWHAGETWADGPYVAPGVPMESAMNVMRALAWSPGSMLTYDDPPAGSPTLVIEAAEVLRSALADEIWSRQRAFLHAGYPCRVLLAGEPGTGKSNVARCVAEQAGGLCLRFRAADVEQSRSLGRLVRFLQPSAVVVDDLCRAENKGQVLDEFDVLSRAAKLLIVTVNRIDGLDSAVYRRFNALDVYTISKLDDGVLDRMLAGVPADAAQRLRELPVKYIDDYRRESAVFGHAAALTYVDALYAQRDEVRRLASEQAGEAVSGKVLTLRKVVEGPGRG